MTRMKNIFLTICLVLFSFNAFAAAPLPIQRNTLTTSTDPSIANTGIITNLPVDNAGSVIYGTSNQVNRITLLTHTNFTLGASFPISTWIDLELTNTGGFFFNISSIPASNWPNGTNILGVGKTLVRLYKSTADSFVFVSYYNSSNTVVYTPTTLAIANNQVGSNTYVLDVSKVVSFITMTNNVRIVGPTGTAAAGYGQQGSLRVTNAGPSSFVLYITNTFLAPGIAGRVWTNTVPAGAVANIAFQDNGSGQVDVAGGTPQ